MSERFVFSVRSTVEPPNEAQVGTSTDVHYSEVVLYWGVSAIGIIIHYMYTGKSDGLN